MRIALALLLFVSFLVLADDQLPAHIRTQDPHSICTTKTSDIRNVPERVKKAVYKRDGVPGGNHTGICAGPSGCEVDHIVSLELGGSNDPSNLMIQPYDRNCNAHQKDHLENTLHSMICENRISVSEAQDLIYNDWQRGYKLYVDGRGCEL